MDGWGVICTNSVYMVLLWFYIRGWVKGMDQGMDHAYATDKTERGTETQAEDILQGR